jgi:UDP-3-O-[3-hydroxymyristoyl] glucosamine N-acyltransferase
VAGNVNIGGYAGVAGDMDVRGSVGITENISVGGYAKIAGNVDVSGNMVIIGNADICGNVFCSAPPLFQTQLVNKKYVDSILTGEFTNISGNVNIAEDTQSTNPFTGALVVG